MKKKKPGLSLKELVFYYLAASKAIYWMGIIATIDGLGEFGMVFLNRLIEQDLILITALVAMHFLEKYMFAGTADNDLKTNAKYYLIGLTGFVGLLTAYHLVLGLFMDVTIAGWPQFFLQAAIMFSVVSMFLYAKDKMKKKEAEKYIPDVNTPEGQVELLTKLCGAGVLTQEECDAKVAECSKTE